METTRSGSQPSGKGPVDYFTGSVRIDPLFQPPEQNVGAADVELTQADLRDIDVVVSKITLQGERYPAFLQAMIDR